MLGENLLPVPLHFPPQMSSQICEVGDILQAIRRRVACGELGCAVQC